MPSTSSQSVGTIQVWPRTDCCPEMTSNFYVLVSDSAFTSTDLNTTLAQPGVSSYYVSGYGGAPATVAVNRTGRYVRVQKSDSQYLILAEVQVWGSSGSGGLKYVLQDLQGSTRAVMQGSAVIARYDQMPFGEEISSGTGLRTTAQGYSVTQDVRHRYGSTERDDATGLDHTWWRKYESFSGRWTSPDPYNGSATIANPQSFNRYSYVLNDPVNFVDPTGLCNLVVQVAQTCVTINGERSCAIVGIWWECKDANPNGSGGGGGGERRSSGGGGFISGVKAAGSYLLKNRACFVRCLQENRLDKVINDVGTSLGHPKIGEFVGDLTVIGTVAAIGNTALNLTSLGRYPRVGISGTPAGSPTTWQHTISGRIGRSLGAPIVGRVGRAVGRASSAISAGLLAFEAGYTAGEIAACNVACTYSASSF